MYAVLQAPIQFGKDVHDLWMQAQLGVKEADYLTRPFVTTKLYRAWINHDSGGIPPGGSVTITVPFYTELQPWTQVNSGTVQDQFIDWWNAMRVYVFDGKDAADAAYNFSQDNPPPGVPVKPVLPPYPITPMTGAAVPTCNAGCTLDLRSYYIGFPNGIPGQLVEYTFAAAEGPPNQSKFSIDLAKVNYNISAVDSIYLPVAIGAKNNSTTANTFLGSVLSVQNFQAALNEFSPQGSLWPYFIPAYSLCWQEARRKAVMPCTPHSGARRPWCGPVRISRCLSMRAFRRGSVKAMTVAASPGSPRSLRLPPRPC